MAPVSGNSSPMGFTLSGFLVRLTIYSSVAGALVLPFYTGDTSVTNLSNHYQDPIFTREAQYLLAWVKAQQAYYQTHKKFTDSIPALKLAARESAKDYEYKMWVLPEQGPFQNVSETAFSFGVAIVAIPLNFGLHSYTAVIGVDGKDTARSRTVWQICRTTFPSSTPPKMPTFFKSQNSSEPRLNCPYGSSALQ